MADKNAKFKQVSEAFMDAIFARQDEDCVLVDECKKFLSDFKDLASKYSPEVMERGISIAQSALKRQESGCRYVWEIPKTAKPNLYLVKP